MSFGFYPSGSRRHPVYSERLAKKLGYIEQNGGLTWFQDIDGKRIARILRWHEDFSISTTLCGSTINPASDDRWEE